MTTKEFIDGVEFTVDSATKVKWRYREGQELFGIVKGYLQKSFTYEISNLEEEWQYECNVEQLEDTEFRLYYYMAGQLVEVFLDVGTCTALPKTQ